MQEISIEELTKGKKVLVLPQHLDARLVLYEISLQTQSCVYTWEEPHVHVQVIPLPCECR